MVRKMLIILFVVSMCMFTSSAFGSDVSTLLEEGIYAEETKGDLDEAISIYQKIIDENDGNMESIAKAFYRLGACYLKTGNDVEAIKIFKELLDRYSDQEEIVSRARSQLVKLNALDGGIQIKQPIKIGPAPWDSGETCHYIVKASTGAAVGKMSRSVEEVAANGNDLWRIDHYIGIPIENRQLFYRSDVLKESYIPVSGIMKGTTSGIAIDNKYIYEKDHVTADINTMDNKSKKEIPISDNIYADDQVANLIRTLPVKDDYSTSFSLLSTNNGTIVKANLITTGKETVTVPAGTFECYCMELEFGSTSTQLQSATTKQKLWFSTDEKRYLVKHEAQQIIMELEKVTRISAADIVEFHDDELGISLSAPNGWNFIKSPVTATYKIILQVIPAELEPNAQIMFVSNIHGGLITKDSLKGVVELDSSVLKQLYKNYSVNPESWTTSLIGGLDALSCYADYDDKDKKMVEYRTYIIDSSHFYAFIIRTEKATFEDDKKEIDSVIQSFKKD